MPGIDFDILRAMTLSRVRRGISQTTIARASGVPKTTLCHFLSGKVRRLTRGNYVLLCRWLGVPGEYFVPGEKRALVGDGTLDKIESLLLSDPNLTNGDAHKLTRMMRSSYEALAAA